MRALDNFQVLPAGDFIHKRFRDFDGPDECRALDSSKSHLLIPSLPAAAYGRLYARFGVFQNDGQLAAQNAAFAAGLVVDERRLEINLVDEMPRREVGEADAGC